MRLFCCVFCYIVSRSLNQILFNIRLPFFFLHHKEAFEDTKGVIRIRRRTDTTAKRKSYKRSNSDLQNTYIAKDRVTRTPLRTGGREGG